jgi:RNA polymerase sigma-B factor
MDETTFGIWRVDDIDVVQVDGVLDFAATVRLQLTLFGRLDAGARHLVVDLTALRLIDTSAVNVLLAMHQRLDDLGGSLVTPGARGLVLNVLQTAGVAKQLGAYDPLDPRLAARTADMTHRIDTDAAGRHGHWGDEINALMGQLREVAADDVTGRQVLRERVIRLSLPFAQRLARRFHGLGEPIGDLNQVAALGLLKAVDRYDASLATDFATYATPTIVGELKRHFRDRGWSVRVPRRLQELRLEINRVRDELSHQLGGSPTVAGLAALLDVDEEAVIEAMVAAGGYRATSLFAPIGRHEQAQTLADRLGCEDRDYETVETREALRPLLAELPEREQRIIAMRFFGNMTQAQIAERLGISQMQVSRLLTRTLSRLREELLTGG